MPPSRFRVFLGAPTTRDIQRERDSNYQPAAYYWATSTSQLDDSPPPQRGSAERRLLSQAEFDSASQQISKVYARVVNSQRTSGLRRLAQSGEWDQSEDEGLEGGEDITKEISLSYSNDSTPSILRSNNSPGTLPNRSNSSLKHDSVLSFLTDSLSDSTSMAVFPRFRFNFNDISSLSKLLAEAEEAGPKRRKRILKISFLAAVLEVDGPIAVHIKKGPEAGNLVSLLKLIIGDDGGCVLRLTAWRESADVMAGYDEADNPGIKKGDVVAFQNILFCDEPPDEQTLVASPKLGSIHEVCYRTLPTVHADRRVTPDLRLGFGDLGVRRVTAIAKWISESAGLSA